jgi:23S rRNA (adenine1618-N6)-methyltransferase
VSVRLLNQALLRVQYGITEWNIPADYLCPPVPGRADYIHHVADLLAERYPGRPTRAEPPTLLDIGVGANCIYPIVGVTEYGWKFVGSELDPGALAAAKHIVSSNHGLQGKIELRQQRNPSAIFAGVTREGESFAASVCNPPFHETAAAAAARTQRKLRNLAGGKRSSLVRNFGGKSHELWCRGGEVAFIRQMIQESAERPRLCLWFTTLVSRSENLRPILDSLARVNPAETRSIDMAHGQKKTRILAWRFT